MRKISTHILLTLLIFMLAACAGTAVETTTVVSESQQTAVLDETVSTTFIPFGAGFCDWFNLFN